VPGAVARTLRRFSAKGGTCSARFILHFSIKLRLGHNAEPKPADDTLFESTDDDVSSEQEVFSASEAEDSKSDSIKQNYMDLKKPTISEVSAVDLAFCWYGRLFTLKHCQSKVGC
jgi:hypothetical protein